MLGLGAALSVLYIHFLDRPFNQDGAYIPPDEMATTLRLIEDEISPVPSVTLPCDEQGRPG